MPQYALVGCAHIHTPNFIKRMNARSDVTVKMVWDHDTARAQNNAVQLNAQVVSDPDAIWSDPAIEAVIICSETNRHERLVLAAAAARKHMFVEKPLGMGAEDAYRMAQAIESAGVLFQTGYFMRGQPIHLFLREHLEKGSFGKITRIRHTNCHAGSLRGWFDTEWRWMTDLKQAGIGGFGDLGTHSLDILLWLMPDTTVERVTATIQVTTGRYGDCDETGEGLIEFDNGTIASLAAGWVDVAHPINLVISGTEGHAYVVNDQLFFKSDHIDSADGASPWITLPEGWPHAFELFLDAVAGKSDASLVSPQEAATRSAVMEAFYHAARQKTWRTPAIRLA